MTQVVMKKERRKMYRALAKTWSEEWYEVYSSSNPIQHTETEHGFVFHNGNDTFFVPKNLIQEIQITDEPQINYYDKEGETLDEEKTDVYIVEILYKDGALHRVAFEDVPSVEYETDTILNFTDREHTLRINITPDIRFINNVWGEVVANAGPESSGTESTEDA